MRLLLVGFLVAVSAVACGGPGSRSSDDAAGVVAMQTAAGPALVGDSVAGDVGRATNAGLPAASAIESGDPGDIARDGEFPTRGSRAHSGTSAPSPVTSVRAAPLHVVEMGAYSEDSGGTVGVAAITVTGTPVLRVPGNETLVSINTATPTPTRTATRTPTATPTRTPTPGAGGPPVVGGCQILPSDNPWNTNISSYPVHANSANYIAAINGDGHTMLHPDWGGGGAYGIPFIVVPSNQPMVSITWTAYGDESDPGPYPIPLNAPIEGGASSDGDRHVLAIRQGECVLYELGRAFPGTNSWEADVGAKWPLNSNALRPMYWTSVDAAGLPILPGLARYDEVAAGSINHALRFTTWRTQKAFILPATHYASSRTDPNLPPMGLRLRLKASFDISGYTGESRVVLQALKTYGMMVADNGSSWYVTGAADPRWDDEDLEQLKGVPSSAFEVVDTGAVLY